MPLNFAADMAVADGKCLVEDALMLLEFLQAHGSAQVDLGSCSHVHTAVLQVLLAELSLCPRARCADGCDQRAAIGGCIPRGWPADRISARKAAASMLDLLHRAAAAAIDAFSPQECVNYFTAAGYEPE
jgi:hypothetical protein